jgi:uncharacterized protein (DUF2249 family)
VQQLIDVSALEPPEPLERILDALADLPSGDWLLVRHRRDPVPLYRMLREMGYRWETTCLATDRFEILIWPANRPPPGRAAAQGADHP